MVLPDICFLQGIFDIIPFAHDDMEAKNALWSIIERLLICIGVSDQSSLHQYISVLVRNSDMIEEELIDLQLDDASEGDKSVIRNRNVRIRVVSFLSSLLHYFTL